MNLRKKVTDLGSVHSFNKILREKKAENSENQIMFLIISIANHKNASGINYLKQSCMIK